MEGGGLKDTLELQFPFFIFPTELCKKSLEDDPVSNS